MARCIIRAQPLDLIFILDSSGSLRDQFQDEIDVIRRIIKHVTIGDTATRVMLVQFSGTQHLEFNFHQFTTRDELLAALDVLRHVSGITRIGGAIEFTLEALKDPANGMRDSSVPKIVYILSDGRTHDYPKDLEMVGSFEEARYKIVTNANLQTLEARFDPYHGTETCEKVPACVKGSDKPVDLALVIDASESLYQLFQEQVHFAIKRISSPDHLLGQNVHSLQVQRSTIRQQFGSDCSSEHTLRSIKGTTSTDLALKDTLDLLTSRDPNDGVRAGVPKLVIILTDGHSARSPKEIADEMRAKGITILAISVTPEPRIDINELIDIAGGQARVFTPRNAHVRLFTA
ncbi:hypothetical protein KIN20_015659 [Parelaphostrongylus tenuis]|uniref:VWFA domain-containing protein n=1 Tax=Parelaphostrongylus tenuis TaxID=148309 RepID=A0AAD5MF97_PARTN|nr:hypothetical protein KIN20_015659 [Parelaphostrongylus tenuis]